MLLLQIPTAMGHIQSHLDLLSEGQQCGTLEKWGGSISHMLYMVEYTVSYVISLCLSEEFEEVPCRHELHDDVDRVVVQTHSQHLHNVRVVEVTVGRSEVLSD